MVFQALKLKNPLKATLETVEQRIKCQRYINGLKAINALEDIASIQGQILK